MAAKTEYVVVVAGKWGGVRQMKVMASSPQAARKEVAFRMRGDERVTNVAKAS